MLKQFLDHIKKSKLIAPNQKVLLAVSGGVDSMVMLDCFRQASYPFAVAHCNFELRGKESDEDEKFVKAFCDRFQIIFFSKRFSTIEYATEKGVSIQMAARDLRYAWFDDVMNEKGFDLLTTAHHLNDNLETVLLNFVRGTGLDGLAGIPERNGKIIRPLLPFSKAAIEEYAKSHSIEWREDVSNQTSNYDRNFIRHQVIPQLQKLNPALEEGFLASKERLIGAKELAEVQIALLKRQCFEESDMGTRIRIQNVSAAPSPAVVLWYFIKSIGFSFEQCKTIIQPHETGSSFYSSSHRLTIDREFYLITEVKPLSHESVQISSVQQIAHRASQSISLKWLDKVPPIEKDTTVAMFDADTLKFPLQWRNWEPGDQFIPLGMAQHKKVSDFLIDQKVPLPAKEHVTVLESGGRICWVVGHRIGDTYKIAPTTKRVLIVRNIQ